MKFSILILLLLTGCSSSTKPLRTVYDLSTIPETRLQVAILDSGLDLTDPRFKNVLCNQGHRDFTGQGITDTHGHGTHVAGLIKDYAENSNYCLVIYHTYSDSLPDGAERLFKALEALTHTNVKIVNLSGGGQGSSMTELSLLQKNIAQGKRFIVAAGNNGEDISKVKFYPASYELKGVTVVGALDALGWVAKGSNYGSVVKAWELGDKVLSTLPSGHKGFFSGTSQATAIATGKLLKSLH